jgi:MacB-like periplasmic core domain/FtsX-like permease family
VGGDAVSGPLLVWSRAEVRRRWLSLVVLGILGGLAAGLALAAFDGAGRTRSAYDRMRSQLLASDAIFFPSQVRIDDADITKLSQLPEVAAVAGFSLTISNLDEIPGSNPLVPVGPDWFRTIERAKVLEGRLPDPSRDDEAVINADATKYGFHVGSTVTWRNMSPADVQAVGGYPPPDYDWSKVTGPVTTLRIVGIVRLPIESVVALATGPQLWPGPGWAAAHLDQSAVLFTNAFVRLRHGAADLPAFQAGVARVYGRDDIPIKDLTDDIKRVQGSLEVEHTALLLFAAAVALSAAVLVGQALVRSIRAGSEPVPVLRAMGLSHGGLVAGLVLPHALTIAVCLVVTAVTAVALSSRFPIGLAHKLDPQVGVHISGSVLGLGLLATLLTTALACAVLAAITVRHSGAGSARRRGQLVGAATRAGASVPAAVGASLALEAPPRRAGGTARPALIAAIVGVVGVVGAVTLVGGIDDALHQPERVGRVWDLEASPSDGDLDEPTAVQIVTADPDVVAAGVAKRASALVQGHDAPLYSIEGVQGSMRFVTLHGRAPDGDDEIALGPRTAAVLHKGIGDTVTVGPASTPLKVVGITLLAQTPHSSFDEGGWVKAGTLPALTGADDDAIEGSVLIRVRRSASVSSVQATLAGKGLDAEPPSVPPDVANLSNVRSLPLVLAGFLALLGVGAVAHALLTGARSRSHDLAVLRALGLTPRQAGACVTWQAAVIGVIALAVGIPVGVVVGRQVWRLLADSLSFVYVGPLSGVALLVVTPVVLAALAALALWPARAAARLHTAEVLRSE